MNLIFTAELSMDFGVSLARPMANLAGTGDVGDRSKFNAADTIIDSDSRTNLAPSVLCKHVDYLPCIALVTGGYIAGGYITGGHITVTGSHVTGGHVTGGHVTGAYAASARAASAHG